MALVLDVDTFAAHAARGRHSVWRYLATTPLALVTGMALVFAIGLPLQLAGLLPSDLAAQAQTPSRPLAFFGLTAVVFGALLAGFAAAVRLVHRKRARDLLGAWRWRHVGWGVGLWLVALVALALVDFAIAPGGFRFAPSAQTPPLALLALVALIPQTFCEEYIFRGYVAQGVLNATGRPWTTAAVSGVLFGLLHLPNGTPQAVAATIIGIVLCMIAMRTGGIAFGFGMHLVNNWFGAVVLVSGGDVFNGLPGLIVQTTPQLMWWDVGMTGVALLALAAVVMRGPRFGAVAAA